MKRKSKKTFRGTPEQHRKAAKVDVRMARNAQKDFNYSMNKGNCHNALTYLVVATSALSHYSAEAFYSDSRKTKNARGVMQQMANRFSAKCLR